MGSRDARFSTSAGTLALGAGRGALASCASFERLLLKRHANWRRNQFI